MRLNSRLLTIFQYANKPYQVIWDCCCDHGLLGFKLLQSGKVKQVNFVDLVPSIIKELQSKLTKYNYVLPKQVSWQTYCQDVSEINLNSTVNQHSKCSELVIISGVGGELICEMMQALVTRHQGVNVDFLLCPVHHTYKLRHCLYELKLGIKHECLIEDNRRTYELLLVNPSCKDKISFTGDKMWENNPLHKAYLSRLIEHYQRVTNQETHKMDLSFAALRDYQLLHEQLFN